MAYAQYCIDVQNYDEAEKLLTSILNYYRSCLPPTHPKIGKVFRDLSQVYLALGDIEKSDQFIQKALSILSQSFSAKHLETAHALLILGHINTEKANYELAEKALKDAHYIYERTTHPARCLTHEALSQLYYSQFVGFSKKHLLKLSKNHLSKAMNIAKDAFPTNSIHLTRLKKIEKSHLQKRYTHNKKL